MGAVHEDSRPATLFRQALVQRPDQVRAANAGPASQHLGVDRVIDERGDRLARSVHCLDHMTARIVQLLGVVVVGNLPFGLAGGNLEPRRLEVGGSFVERLGHPGAHQFQILLVPCGAARAVREAITIRRAMRVRRANQNVLRRNLLHRRPHPVAQRGGKAEKVRADNRRGCPSLLQHQRPYR